MYNKQVCVEQFKRTYSIGVTRLQNLRNQMQKAIDDGDVFMSPKKDARGLHKTRPNAISTEIKAQIDQMMYDVITKRGSPTHYGGRYRRDAIHLPSSLSVPLLWEMFHLLNDNRDPSYMSQISAQREHPAEDLVTLEPMVKLPWFRDYFNAHYGQVKFWRGKTDQCAECAKLNEHIDSLKKLPQVLHDHVHFAIIAQVESVPPIATTESLGLIHTMLIC